MGNISRLFISSIFLLHMVGLASSATVHGTIYEWHTLEPLQDVIVEVNSTPPQRFVAREGFYEFELGKGKYCIRAGYYENDEFIYYSEENVSIETDGDFIIDIIMFPDIDLDKEFFEDFDINLSIGESLPEGMGEENDGELFFWVTVIAIISLILLYFLKFRRETRKERRVPISGALPDDLREVVEILEGNDGRMTQLELREKLHYSEAKVSLMLADLEERKIIRKFKRGRGNVIILEKRG